MHRPIVRSGACSIAALLTAMMLLFTPDTRAGDARVSVPVRLDYPLVRELLLKQLFTGPQQTRDLIDDPGGCSSIVLAEPQVAPRDGALEMEAALTARIGLGMMGNCNRVIDWQGTVGLLGRPVVAPGGRQVGLDPQRLWLRDANGVDFNNPRLQELTESSLHPLLRQFRLDLAPTLDSLGSLLPTVLPRHQKESLEAIVASLHLQTISANQDTLDVDIAFDVAPAPPSAAARALSADEMETLEERWQMMDALLVLAVKHYAASTELLPLRDALLDVLIESRYRLQDALTEPVAEDSDPVRDWFLQSWQQLAPIVRRIALEQPGQEHLAFFTVITATEALQALDQLGPRFGLDVSAAGLRRLARLVNAGASDELLEFSEAVDPQLKRLMEQHFAPQASAGRAWRLDFSLFPRAWAATDERLNSWVPATDDLPVYLPLVATLLDEAASGALKKYSLDATQQQLFRQLVLATAWQESCWRQYVVRDQQRVPLRSNSGDVGIMQLNERVWRGFYDIQQLRWNLDYNSTAGAEVLIGYMVKYALRKGEHRQPGGLPNLARASYSAYNGGPSKVSRYRQSKVSAYEKKVDSAFWEKYRQVDAGNALGVSTCLGGDLTGTALPSAKRAVATTGDSPGTSAPRGWLDSQDPQHFTVQLGAFSERQFAEKFLRQTSLGASARIHPQSSGASPRFLVLYGTYPSRAAAEAAAARMAQHKPWIRRIGDIASS